MDYLIIVTKEDMALGDREVVQENDLDSRIDELMGELRSELIDGFSVETLAELEI